MQSQALADHSPTVRTLSKGARERADSSEMKRGQACSSSPFHATASASPLNSNCFRPQVEGRPRSEREFEDKNNMNTKMKNVPTSQDCEKGRDCILLASVKRLVPSSSSAAQSPSKVFPHPSEFSLDTNVEGLESRFLKRLPSPSPSEHRSHSISRTFRSTTFAGTRYQSELFDQIAAHEASERLRQHEASEESRHRWDMLRLSQEETKHAAHAQASAKRKTRAARLAQIEETISLQAKQREGAGSDERKDRSAIEESERSARYAMRFEEWRGKTNIHFEIRKLHLVQLESDIRSEACGHFIMDLEARYRNFIFRDSTVARTQLLSLEKAERITQLKYLHRLWNFKAKQEAELVSLSACERRSRAKVAEEEGSAFSLIDVSKIGLLSEMAREQRRRHEAYLSILKLKEEEDIRAREALVAEDVEQRGLIRQEESALRAIFREQFVIERQVAEDTFRSRIEMERLAWESECARQQVPVMTMEEKLRRNLCLTEQGDYNELLSRHQESWQNVLRPINSNVMRVVTSFSPGSVYVLGSGSQPQTTSPSDRWAFPLAGICVFRKTTSVLYPAGPCADFRIEVKGTRGIHAGDEVDIPIHTASDAGLAMMKRDSNRPLPKEHQWTVNGQQVIDGHGHVVCYFGSERTAGIANRGGSDEDRLSNAMAANSLVLFWADIVCGTTGQGNQDTLKVANRLLSIIGFRCDPSCTNVDSRELSLRIRANFVAAMPSQTQGGRSSALRRRRSASPAFRASGVVSTDEQTNTADLHIFSVIHLQTPKIYFKAQRLLPSVQCLAATNLTSMWLPTIPVFVPQMRKMQPSLLSAGANNADTSRLHDKLQVFHLAQRYIAKGEATIPEKHDGTQIVVNNSGLPPLMPHPDGIRIDFGDKYVSFSAVFVEAQLKGKSRCMPFEHATLAPGNDFSSFSLTVKLSYIAGADDNLAFIGSFNVMSPTLETNDIVSEFGNSNSFFGMITDSYTLKKNEIQVSATLHALGESGSTLLDVSTQSLDVQGRLCPSFPVSTKEVTISGTSTPRYIVTQVLRRVGVVLDHRFTKSRHLEALLSFSEGASSSFAGNSAIPSDTTALITEVIPTMLITDRNLSSSSRLPSSLFIFLPESTLSPRLYVDNRLGLPSWYSQRASVNWMQLMRGARISKNLPATRDGGLGDISGSVGPVPACTVVITIEQGASVDDALIIDLQKLSNLQMMRGNQSPLRGRSEIDTLQGDIQSYTPLPPSAWRLIIEGNVIKCTSHEISCAPPHALAEPSDSQDNALITIGNVCFSQVKQCKLQPELVISLRSLPSDVFATLLQSVFFTTRATLTSASALKVIRVTISPTPRKASSTSKPPFLSYNIPFTVITAGQRLRVQPISSAPTERVFSPLIDDEAESAPKFSAENALVAATGVLMAAKSFSNLIEHKRKQQEFGNTVPVVRLGKVSLDEDSGDTLEPLRMDERLVLPTTAKVKRVTVSIVDGLPSLAAQKLGDTIRTGASEGSILNEDISNASLSYLSWECEIASSFRATIEAKKGLSVSCLFDEGISSGSLKELLRSIQYHHNFSTDVVLLKTLLVQIHTEEDVVEERLVQVDVQPIFLPSYFVGMLERKLQQETSELSGLVASADTESPSFPKDEMGETSNEGAVSETSRRDAVELQISYIGTSLLNDSTNGAVRLFPNANVCDEDTVACGDGYFVLEALEGMRPGDRLVLLDSKDILIEQSTSQSGGKTRLIEIATGVLVAETDWTPPSGAFISEDQRVAKDRLDDALGEDVMIDAACIVISISNKTLLSDCSKLIRLFGFTREDPFGYVDPHTIQCLLRFNARDEIVSDTRFPFSIFVASPPLYTLPVERTVRAGLHGSRLRPFANCKLALPSHRSIGTSLTIFSDNPNCSVSLLCPTIRSVTPSSPARKSSTSHTTLLSHPNKSSDLIVDHTSGALICDFSLAKRLAGVNTMRPTPGVDGIVVGKFNITDLPPNVSPYPRRSSSASRPASAIRPKTHPSSAVSVQSSSSQINTVGCQSLQITLEPNVPCALLRVILNHIGVDTDRCRSNPTIFLHWNMYVHPSSRAKRRATPLPPPEAESFVTKMLCDVEGEAAGISVVLPTDRFVAFDSCNVKVFDGIQLSRVDISDADESVAESNASTKRPSILELRSPHLTSDASLPTVAVEEEDGGVTTIEVEVIGPRTADLLLLHPVSESATLFYSSLPLNATDVGQKKLPPRRENVGDNSPLLQSDADQFYFETKSRTQLRIVFKCPQSLESSGSILQRITFAGVSRLSGPVRLLQMKIGLANGRSIKRQVQVSLRPKALFVPSRPRALTPGEMCSLLHGVFASDQKLLSASTFTFQILSNQISRGRSFDRLAVAFPDGLLWNSKTCCIHLGMGTSEESGAQTGPTSEGPTIQAARFGPTLASISASAHRDLRLTMSGASALTLTTIISILESVVMLYSDDLSPIMVVDPNSSDTGGGKTGRSASESLVSPVAFKQRARGASLLKSTAFVGASNVDATVRISWECEIERNSAFSSGKVITDEVLFNVSCPSKS